MPVNGPSKPSTELRSTAAPSPSTKLVSGLRVRAVVVVADMAAADAAVAAAVVVVAVADMAAAAGIIECGGDKCPCVRGSGDLATQGAFLSGRARSAPARGCFVFHLVWLVGRGAAASGFRASFFLRRRKIEI